jgi:Domain of unknown function (DUF5615)
MTIHLYFDEDSMRRALIHELRARGTDVLTALDAGMIERTDEEHLAFATAQGRVLCSFNVADFYQLHTDHLAQQKAHAGIVLVRQQQYSVGEYLRRLLRLMAHLTAEEMQNRVEFLSSWGEKS